MNLTVYTLYFFYDLHFLHLNIFQKAVREFFTPLKILRMRIPKSAANKPLGKDDMSLNALYTLNNSISLILSTHVHCYGI